MIIVKNTLMLSVNALDKNIENSVTKIIGDKI